MIKQLDYRFGGSGTDWLHTILETDVGGYVLGGYSNSPISGDKSQGTQGSTDYWVVKINSFGIKQWDKRFGGSAEEDLRSVLKTSDGGYLLGGSSSSGISGDRSQASRGGYDYWLVKIDSNGTKQWDNRYGGDSTDDFSGMVENYPNGYILAGSSKSTASGDKTQGTRGGYDYWIVYIDYYGNKITDYRFGGSNHDFLQAIQLTNDGLALGGLSYSGISGDKTQACWGAYDYWIVKLDIYSNIQWDYRFGGSSNDDCSGLLQTRDKGYLLGGESNSDSISGDKTQNRWNNSTDYWIVKTDSNGIKEWDYRYGGNAGDGMLTNPIELTLDGGYILGGGSSSNISGNKTTYNVCATTYHYWLVKLKSDGIKQWEYSYGGNNISFATKILQTAEGGYLIGGYSESGIACDKTQASQGGKDYWIVKLRPNWPTTDANLNISNAGFTGKTLTWSNGNGTRRIVVARAGTPFNDSPTVGIYYPANSVFGLGSQIGNGNYVVYNGTGNSVTVTGLNYNTTYYFKVIAYRPDTLFPIYQLSPFLSGSSTTLPVKWLDINAKIFDENTVQINWSTASELNNSHYEIERSTDVKQWKMIGRVSGNGTTNRVSNYAFMDNEVSTSLNLTGASLELTGGSLKQTVLYYRIKQIDFDGQFEYSKTVQVQFNKVPEEGIEIYPNPFTDILTIRSNTKQTGVPIEIFDCIGSKIIEGVFDFTNPQLQAEINLGGIASGMYFISINGITSKLIKRN